MTWIEPEPEAPAEAPEPVDEDAEDEPAEKKEDTKMEEAPEIPTTTVLHDLMKNCNSDWVSKQSFIEFFSGTI